ncbi:hypothetical protein [Streptomyces sp. IBSBF 3136]|uniref:hypothetical protein n=1 Tax=Streptomyces sp. IBSBF 3136 TaxID=2903524 RepID=UPI002FDC0E93
MRVDEAQQQSPHALTVGHVPHGRHVVRDGRADPLCDVVRHTGNAVYLSAA